MSEDRKNIVLVSIDSLRADHCGYMGDDRGLTPTLDDLAEEGVAFRNAISPGPRTFSSMPAAFTGRHRARNTLDSYPDGDEWRWRLDTIDDHLARYPPFAERVRDLGYTTAGVSPNPWASSASGFDRGFDHFEDLSGHDDETMVHRLANRVPGVDPGQRGVEIIAEMVSRNSFFVRWEDLYREVATLREQLTEPYLLWVFLLDTHYPFITSRRHREEQSLPGMYLNMYRSGRAMRGNTNELPDRVHESAGRSYRDTVRAADAFLSTLRSDLAADAPALVVHSDHGEAFGEHGGYGHHRGKVYEENVHVPYVVHNTGSSADVDEPISLSTIHETIVRIARDGRFDPDDVTDSYVVASDERGEKRTVRGARYKYLEDGDRERLFDLRRDPDERMDISGQRSDVAGYLKNHLRRFEANRSETGRLEDAVQTIAVEAEL